MIKDTFRVYRNEKLRGFMESFSDEHDKEIIHKTIQFIRTEFPECEDAIRGNLIHEETS